MDVEHVLAYALRVGDPIGVAELPGWWLVDAVQMHSRDVRLIVSELETGEPRELIVEANRLIRRGEPTAVHRPAEFLGMSLQSARAWAGALGWTLDHRNPGQHRPAVIIGPTRNWVAVWTDDTDMVVRAEFDNY